MPDLRLTHVALTARDLDASIARILHHPIRANSGEPNGSAAPGLPILDRMSDDLKPDAVEQRRIFVRAQAGVIERVAPILPNAFTMGWPAIEHKDGRWRGVPSEHILLAGFSQGGALALYAGTRHTHKLAGIMGLSCYMLLAARFAAERAPANQATPIFLAHGTQDPVVAPVLGEQTRRLLEENHYAVEWHAYSMPHSVCPQEVTDIAAWLRRVL